MITASENILKPISLKEITYPLFKLGEKKPTLADGVLYYSNTLEDEHGNLSSTIKIIDDTNVPGSSLSKRRLYIQDNMPDVTLYRIGIALFFLGDLIKIAKPKTWFIDSLGNVLNYQKTRTVPLLIKRITRVINISTGFGVILELEGISGRFKSLYPPKQNEVYAGVLRVDHGYIFYGYYSDKFDNSRRKI